MLVKGCQGSKKTTTRVQNADWWLAVGGLLFFFWASARRSWPLEMYELWNDVDPGRRRL